MFSFKRLAILFTLLVSSSGQLLAQCPQGKTAFIWVNGILVTDLKANGAVIKTGAQVWAEEVMAIGDKFFATHPNLSRTCIVFVPVYNTSHGAITDLSESNTLINLADLLSKYANNSLSAAELADLVKTFAKASAKGISSSDPDLLAVYDEIAKQWNAGYRQVIVAGHSEGAVFANQAYTTRYLDDRIVPSPKLPNPNILSIIVIATPADNVADGRKMYTMQCNDAIQFVKFFTTSPLPPNLPDNSGALCIAPEVVAVGALLTPFVILDAAAVMHDINVHDLSKSYLVDGTASQRQIYDQMVASLPDPACVGDPNCYLKDNFSGSDYTINIAQIGDLTAAQGSTIRTLSGALVMQSYNNYTTVLTGPGIANAPARLTSRTKRAFTGPFKINFQYYSVGTGKTFLGLFNTVDNTSALYLEYGEGVVATYPDANSIAFSPAGWHTLTFAKTDSQVSLSVDGKLWVTNTSTPTAGYYLGFDLQGNNTLQIQDLSVIRDVNAPQPPTYTAAPPTQSVSVVAGQSVFADVTFSGKNNPAGNGSLLVYCQSTCPAGFTYNFTSAVALAANGSSNWRFNVSAISAVPGTYTYTPTLTIGNTTVTAKIAVTVTAPTASTPTLAFTPPTQSVSVVAGQPVFVDNTLKGINNTAGTVGLALWCMQAICPAGFSYSFPTTAALAANGSANTHTTFTTISTTPLGTFNYEYRGALGNLTAVAKIAVTVTAPVSAADFTAVAVSSSITLQQSSNGSLQATVTPSGGLTGAVNITFAGAPAGVTIATASGNITGAGAITLTSTVSVSAPTVAGSYPLTATITAGGKTKTVAFTLVVTKPAVTTGTVGITTTGNIPATCLLNGVSFTAPVTLTNQPAGIKTLTCTAPGYTVSISPASQNLVAGGTVNFAVTLTLIPLPPFSVTCSYAANPATVGQTDPVSIVQTGGVLPVTYIANGANLGTGTTLNITPVSAGFSTVVVTATDAKARQASNSCTVPVVAPLPPFSASCSFARNPATVGQLDPVTMSQSGGVAPVTFIANGLNLGTGNTLNITPTATGSATVQFTATDAKGRQAGNSCTVPVVAPQPVLNSLAVNTSPKVNTAINVSLFGSGFVSGSQGYVCSSTAASSCSAFPTVFVNSGQLSLPSVRWSTPATIYLKVMNGSLSSGFVTMVVIK